MPTQSLLLVTELGADPLCCLLLPAGVKLSIFDTARSLTDQAQHAYSEEQQAWQQAQQEAQQAQQGKGSKAVAKKGK